MLVRNKPVDITRRPRLSATSYYKSTNPDIVEDAPVMDSKFNNPHLEAMWQNDLKRNPNEEMVKRVKEFFETDNWRNEEGDSQKNSNIANDIYTALWQMDRGMEFSGRTNDFHHQVKQLIKEFNEFRELEGNDSHHRYTDPYWIMDELFTQWHNTDFFILFVEWQHMCLCEQGDAMARSNHNQEELPEIELSFLNFVLAKIELKIRDKVDDLLDELRSDENYGVIMYPGGNTDEIPF